MKTKKIKLKDLKVGMKIKTYDPLHKSIVFKEVLDVFNTEVVPEDQVQIEFVNGVILNCSINHPIMVYGDDFLSAQEKYPAELDSNDFVITDNGPTFVKSVKIGQSNPINYIDITVDDLHTFYASSETDGDMILTHNSQGGIRGASATATYPAWHLEFEQLIELKNNKGTEETRIRTLDYSVALHGVLYKRLIEQGNITLFSPEEVPDLYEAYYSNDTAKFEELYLHYENSKKVVKKSISALDFFSKILNERFETGRIYILNADNMNTHTPYYEPIYMSNLCQEISSPSKPMGLTDEMIALCTLAAVNWGKFSKQLTAIEEEYLEQSCDIAVRALDALLTYQEYPVEAAKRFTEKYRSLGIGIIGYAHWLAKAREEWGSDNALLWTETLMEKQAYYLTKASVNLAKEFGAIETRTRYHDGIVPRDLCKIPVNPEKMPWGELREDLKKYGIRNATLMALMPSETSSLLSNETNGIEPPKELITIKESKDGVFAQVVPEYARLNNSYQTMFNVENKFYLYTMAVFQKYVDQSISTNTRYDPSKGEITMSRLIGDVLLSYQLGLKTLYYNLVNDESGEAEEDSGCAGGACKI